MTTLISQTILSLYFLIFGNFIQLLFSSSCFCVILQKGIAPSCISLLTLFFKWLILGFSLLFKCKWITWRFFQKFREVNLRGGNINGEMSLTKEGKTEKNMAMFGWLGGEGGLWLGNMHYIRRCVGEGGIRLMSRFKHFQLISRRAQHSIREKTIPQIWE